MKRGPLSAACGRCRAREAVKTWSYSLAFNERLRALPVIATNPLGVNGWLARVPIAKMPAALLEREVMRLCGRRLVAADGCGGSDISLFVVDNTRLCGRCLVAADTQRIETKLMWWWQYLLT